METLTVTLTAGKLTFSRRVFLGSTYLLAFAGEAANVAGLTLNVPLCGGRVNLAQSVTAGGSTTLALDAEELIREFRGCNGESIGFYAWLSGSSSTLGAGTITVQWSPLVVDIATGHAASLKGDAGRGIASVTRGTGTTVTVTYTDGMSATLDISDLKGDKGDTGSVVGTSAAALINALADGEPANLDALYANVSAIKAALKALHQ